MEFIKKHKNGFVIIVGALVSFFLTSFIFAGLFTLIGMNKTFGQALNDGWVFVIGLFGFAGFLALYWFKIKEWLNPEKKKNLTKHFWEYSKYDQYKNFSLSTKSSSWGWVVESKMVDNKQMEKIKKSNSLSGITKSKNENKKVVYRLLNNTSICLLGTTRSGKTQTIIIPTIIANAKSDIKPVMHITDPKMELCRVTTKTLVENGYQVFIFNIKDPNVSNYFNFLSSPFKKFEEYLKLKNENKEEALKLRNNSFNELDTIISMLIIPDIKDTTEKYFATQGKELFLGFAKLYLEEIEKTYDSTGQINYKYFNLPSLFKSCLDISKDDLKTILNNKKSIEQDWKSSYEHLINQNKLEEAREKLANKPLNYSIEHLNQCLTDEKQYNFYQKAITKGLMFLNDQAFKILSLNNDFDYEHYLEKPLAIFVVTPDEDKSKDALATAFMDTLYTYTVQKIDKEYNGKSPRPILRILEEFNNLAPMNTIRSAILAGGGRNIWTMITIQSKSAVYSTYGKDEAQALLSNTGGIIYVANNESQTNQDIIDTIGTYEEKTHSKSRNESETKNKNISISKSEGETERKILKMSDLRLKDKNCIHLILNGQKPILNVSTIPAYEIYDDEVKNIDNEKYWPKINLKDSDNWIIEYHFNVLNLLPKNHNKQNIKKNNSFELLEDELNSKLEPISGNDDSKNQWDDLLKEAKNNQPKIEKKKKDKNEHVKEITDTFSMDI